jgi:hypothetical protein
MPLKIISLVIIVSTFSFAQIEDCEELFNFSFGSSKEKVIKIWGNSSYAKFGDLKMFTDDTLLIRIDDFKYFDGWKFLFIKDSLYKIQMFSKIMESKCSDIIEWFKANYGEPKISSGDIYYWWYKNESDSTTNKISLSCSCFFCEQISDSARLVIEIRNDKLYKRVGDLTVNKAFLNGVNYFKWRSTSENIIQQISELYGMEVLPEIKNKSKYENTLRYMNGSFADLPVKEYQFTLFNNNLYKIEILFDSELFIEKTNFQKLFDFINTTYGHYTIDHSANGYNYFWYFNNFDDKQSTLGTIWLRQNFGRNVNQEDKLIFEYAKTSLMLK